MARKVYQPTDETAAKTIVSVGNDEDIALGGFVAKAANRVKVVVIGTLYVSADVSSGTLTSTASLQYRKDGGGWSTLETIEVEDFVGGGATTDSWGSAETVVTIPTVIDMSTIDVRIYVVISGAGSGTAEASGTITDWEIQPPLASMVIGA